MFASLTAHTTALLPVLLAAAIAVPEMPVQLISLLFCYTLGLMGIISPYATGPGPIYYGSGYVSRKEFWTLALHLRRDLFSATAFGRSTLSSLLSELVLMNLGQNRDRATRHDPLSASVPGAPEPRDGAP